MRFSIFATLLFYSLKAHVVPLVLCDSGKGLELLSKASFPLAQIEMILSDCDKVSPNDPEVLLLHGLLARKLGELNKNYGDALLWLEKAQMAAPKHLTISLELAATYVLTHQLQKAERLYQDLLAKAPLNRSALLGLSRIYRLQKQWQQAALVYQALLALAPDDIDAINGLAWLKTAENDLGQAEALFEKSLKLRNANPEALEGLKQIQATYAQMALAKHSYIAALPFAGQKTPPPLVPAPKAPPCAAQGLALLSKKNPDLSQISHLLHMCEAKEPQATSTLMLHGLFARQLATEGQGDFQEAIECLRLAVLSAKADHKAPLYELATTYEWAGELKPALEIYQALSEKNPSDKTAILGEARVYRALFKIAPSVALYESLLEKDPHDTKALKGLGETLFANYEFDAAGAVFNEALAQSPKDEDIHKDLKLLSEATKNILGISGGHYAVPPQTSEGLNVFYFRNLDATDALTLFATHNTKQIESGFGSGPTLLPNNSLLLGYQRLLPKRYGWQLSYDARQHDGLPFEHRAFGSLSVFLHKNLEWYNAGRLISPFPWTTKLYISSLTAYTPLPFNISLTGFWSYQTIGGKGTTYALDFNKEFNKRLFYDVGCSYLLEQKSLEVHGRLILPTFKNQAFVAEYSHYFFNRSTFATAGWRFYWA